ncbi:MAG: hypothetical protein NTY17_12630 [Planctomycetia bacterium]|nr:hypothetical protein [Planctomycetia bacterium]
MSLSLTVRLLPLSAVGSVILLVLAAAARAEDPVAVLVTGPLSATVGDRVAFEVELVNRSGRPLEKLRVVDYFDKGFHHEASASPIEQKGTIDLAAGTSRRLTLDFLLDEPGRQCHRVEILDQSHTFVGGATSCVQVAASPVAAATPLAAPLPTTPAPVNAYPSTTYPTMPATPPSTSPAPFVMAAPLATAPLAAATLTPPPVASPPLGMPPVAMPMPTAQPLAPPPALPASSGLPASTALPATPSLELDMVGPAEVLPGSVSEFVATVRNTGSVASGATTLEFGWDDAFTPLEASEGYKLASSRVSWDLPSLEPGGQLRRQINLRAQPAGAVTPSSRSCVRGVLSGAVGGVMVADESCVLIRSNTPRLRTPREAGLRVTLADCDDPVVVGHSTTLICTVVNTGAMSTGRLDLTVVLPERATLVGDPSPSRVRIDGANVSFDSIPSIPPGGQATMELAYRIPGSGTAKATAILTGTELDGSTDSNCQTTFLAP